MTKSYDVVVVGGGVVGCATAYFLSREGLKVCLVDREAIGSGGTGHATGLIGSMGGDLKGGPYFSLINAGSTLYQTLIPEIESETGIKTLYQTKPTVLYALHDRDVQRVDQIAAWRNKEGLKTESVSAHDLWRMEPRFKPEIVRGILSPSEGQVDSARLTLALAQAAENRNAIILLRPVNGLIRTGKRITGVLSGDTKIFADHTVLAMGAWSKAATDWLDTPIPVEPLKGQRIELRLDGKPIPIILMSLRNPHLFSRSDGLISHGSSGGTASSTYGTPQENREGLNFDLRPTEEVKLQLLQGAQYLMPDLADAELVRHWVGVRPNTPDGQPIIGRVPNWEGVYISTGHRGRGIHLGGISGKLITQLITQGSTSISLDPFSLSRFPAQAKDC